MNRKDIIIGIIILTIIAGGIYFWKRPPKTPLEIEKPSSVETTIEDKFKIELPDNAEKIQLKDVSGGTSSAMATRKFDNGSFNQVILADLPEPSQGEFYQAWLEKGNKGEAGYDLVSIGKLTIAKGGYLLEFNSNKDHSEYKKVMVSLEKKFDSSVEKIVLEGTFN